MGRCPGLKGRSRVISPLRLHRPLRPSKGLFVPSRRQLCHLPAPWQLWWLQRNIWLNLPGIKEKDKGFLMDTPLLPPGLFGDAVNTVLKRFQEAKKQAAALQRLIPRQGQAPAREQPKRAPFSLERLIPLADFSAKRFSMGSANYKKRIQNSVCQPRFKGVLSTIVRPEQDQVLEQEVQSLLAKEGIEFTPIPEGDSGFYSQYFIDRHNCLLLRS